MKPEREQLKLLSLFEILEIFVVVTLTKKAVDLLSEVVVESIRKILEVNT